MYLTSVYVFGKHSSYLIKYLFEMASVFIDNIRRCGNDTENSLECLKHFYCLTKTQHFTMFLFIIPCSDWMAVTSQREAVKLCPQFSVPSPLVWERWTWVTTTCRIQEWRDFLLNWRIHAVSLKLSGQDSLFYPIISSKKYSCTIGAGLDQTW